MIHSCCFTPRKLRGCFDRSFLVALGWPGDKKGTVCPPHDPGLHAKLQCSLPALEVLFCSWWCYIERGKGKKNFLSRSIKEAHCYYSSSSSNWLLLCWPWRKQFPPWRIGITFPHGKRDTHTQYINNQPATSIENVFPQPQPAILSQFEFVYCLFRCQCDGKDGGCLLVWCKPFWTLYTPNTPS